MPTALPKSISVSCLSTYGFRVGPWDFGSDSELPRHRALIRKSAQASEAGVWGSAQDPRHRESHLSEQQTISPSRFWKRKALLHEGGATTVPLAAESPQVSFVEEIGSGFCDRGGQRLLCTGQAIPNHHPSKDLVAGILWTKLCLGKWPSYIGHALAADQQTIREFLFPPCQHLKVLRVLGGMSQDRMKRSLVANLETTAPFGCLLCVLSNADAWC